MQQIVAIAVIVALGFIGGSAISQVGRADAIPYYERQMVQELKDIQRELDAIKYNTGVVCQDASSGYFCKKF